jgi:hypothetical protein
MVGNWSSRYRTDESLLNVLAIGGDRGIGSLVAAEMQQVAKDVRSYLLKDCKHWEHPTLAMRINTHSSYIGQ